MPDTSRTEKATPKKRRDEREKGHSFQSRDIISIAVLLLGFYTIRRMSGFVAQQVGTQYESLMMQAALHPGLTISLCQSIVRDILKTYLLTALPIMIACLSAGVLVTGLQTRFLISSELIRFKASRISFVEGFKRLFSLRSVVQLIKALLEIAVIVWLIYTNVRDLLPVVPDILAVDAGKSLAFMLDRTMAMVYKICLFFVVVAVLDFGYQKYDYERKMMMTKEEVKEEYKQLEGDPLVKSRIKERQRSISLNRMIQQVPTADVIVRNPTHFAVALKYQIDVDEAPIVVAKGRDTLARRIIDIGERNGVLVTENKPLAQSLYRYVEVEDYIPEELFRPVAEILAWVYREREERSKA